MKLNFFKQHSFVVSLIAIFVVVAGGIAARAASRKQASTSASTAKPVVTLLKLADYGLSSRTVTANGTVSSLQQVDLKAQASGKIIKLSAALGEKVYAGQTIASIDAGNAAAAVTSALGMLEQARASYNKLLAGASNEQINVAQKAVDSAQAALDSAQTGAASTQAQQDAAVKNARAALLNTGLAPISSPLNTGSVTPTVTGTYTGEEGEYTITLYQTGIGMRFQTSGIETSIGDVKSQPVALGTKGLFIQFSGSPSVSDSWTLRIPNTSSASYTTANSAYEAAIKSRDSALSQSQAQINAARAALEQAKAALAQVQAQARPADIQAAQAAITSAQGQVQAAQAAYRNTLVQSPFSGTVSALPVKLSDVVAPGQTVATVVSEGGLQVKLYVTDADLKAIAIGSSALIGDSKATGTVTNIATAVDAGSKTGEVVIAVADPATAGLTVGQNVSVTISGGKSGEGSGFFLPVQAVKFTPDGKTYIYAVENAQAKEIEVKTGQVQGENVEITGSLDPEMAIVSNAYAVSAGGEVEIQK